MSDGPLFEARTTSGSAAELRAHKPLLVGEANPYGGDPAFALYPLPRTASGWRLCSKIMGLDDREYLARFDRANLCPERWSVEVARDRVRELLDLAEARTYVLLGQKVAGAFADAAAFDKRSLRPFTVVARPARGGGKLVLACLPHPSGLSRAWNEPGAYERARAVLREAGVL